MFRLFFLAASLLCVSSCEKEALLDDCATLEGFSRVDEDDIPCTFTAVYRYKKEIYTIYNCCVCNGFFPPTDCDGHSFCEASVGGVACTNDFIQEAEFLYAVVED